MEALARAAAAWAAEREDVAAVALVGSWARGAARANSDLDLIVLTHEPAPYVEGDGWIEDLAAGACLVRTGDWGAIVERRLRLPSGLEVEVGFGRPSWAAAAPVDPGTRRVVRDGLRPLFDPDGLLRELAAACTFRLIPAVDLLGEEAVRLERGDYERVTLREAEPAALVRRFVGAGAGTVHVVDLDGARSGRLRPELIRALVEAAAPAQVQASGGVRSVADAETLLAAGAARVVVGTAAFAEPDSVDRFADALGEALVVAVDVRDGRVAARGWQDDAGLSVEEALARCRASGVARILCTAIERDGTLAGPDLALLRQAVDGGLGVLAAGGVSSEDDVAAVEECGCEAAIVGRALLEGRIPLSALA